MGRRVSGRGLIWAVAAIPAVLGLAGLGASDWISAGTLLNYLGRLTGIAGLTLLLLAAALSARVPGFDRHFGGLTKLWHTHHLLGAWAMILLMLHPLLLGLAASDVSLSAAVATLFPPLSAVGVWLGWAALMVLMIFLAPSFSFFGKPEYGRWKLLHRLSGPAVILALAHTFLFGRTLPGRSDLIIWSLLALAAVGAVAWRFVFSRRIGRLPYTVGEVICIANNLVELVLKPRKRHLKFHAGQFVYLAPYDQSLEAGYGEEHPYTISSSPHDPNLRIAIKDLGDASRAIQSIEPGSKVTIEGPYGAFFRESGIDQAQLWIAGGIGITPFLGRARFLDHRGEPVDVVLIYCVQDEARARFLEELQALEESLPGLKVVCHYFYRQGPLDLDFIAAHCPDFAHRTAYICGPLPLNHLATRLLRAAGVSQKTIHTEEFELL